MTEVCTNTPEAASPDEGMTTRNEPLTEAEMEYMGSELATQFPDLAVSVQHDEDGNLHVKAVPA